MLKKIKNAIFKRYNKTDNMGVFLSSFSNDGSLLDSQGVLYDDRALEDVVDILYLGLIKGKKNLTYVVIDIVLGLNEVTNISDLKNLSIKDYGLYISEGNYYGVLLPDTRGVDNFAQGIQMVSEKNGITGKNAKIYVFTTDRIVVS